MQPNVIIELNNPLNYKLDAGKLQLDHLEAENPTVISSKYYKFDKLEERKKDVNGYLGNFMVLDAEENNRKKNLPLYDAMSFYSGIKTAWLVDDIAEMIVDNNYSELTDHVPKEDFFTVRSRQLKKYFSEFLNRKFGDTSITVNL